MIFSRAGNLICISGRRSDRQSAGIRILWSVRHTHHHIPLWSYGEVLFHATCETCSQDGTSNPESTSESTGEQVLSLDGYDLAHSSLQRGFTPLNKSIIAFENDSQVGMWDLRPMPRSRMKKLHCYSTTTFDLDLRQSRAIMQRDEMRLDWNSSLERERGVCDGGSPIKYRGTSGKGELRRRVLSPGGFMAAHFAFRTKSRQTSLDEGHQAYSLDINTTSSKLFALLHAKSLLFSFACDTDTGGFIQS